MHTDIPTRSEIEQLLAVQRPACVTLYLPTSPVTREAQGDRIAFKNQIGTAGELLGAAGTSRDDVAAIDESLADLHDDDEFWALQAHSLAVFATPARVTTYRLANRLTEAVHVSDRFYVKPLLRAVSFPNAAFVLALAQNAVRLIEVAADLPAHDVRVPGMPSDAASAVGKASITDRSASGRMQGSEGHKVRLRQYARQVDSALRSVLAGRDLPLILAATPPLDSIFRSVNSYPQLADQGVRGNPETLSDAELSLAARGVLDELYAADLTALRDLFEVRVNQGRGATDVGDVARAATFGAVDTVLVDIDAYVPGVVDETTGAVTTLEEDAPDGYGVADEIARRTLQSGGRVLAVRAEDLPGGGPVAAILRYAV